MICEECKRPWTKVTFGRDTDLDTDIFEGCATEGCSRRILFIGVREAK